MLVGIWSPGMKDQELGRWTLQVSLGLPQTVK